MGTAAEAEDKFDLNRFVQAQEAVYPRALTEIKRGRKQSHWMWFIFPQLAGLGHSAMAQRFAIASKRPSPILAMASWDPG
jgi:uncharacterized protein (DUF1810 family)